MNRRELKDYVLGLLSRHCDEYASTFRDISLVTSNPERIDRYGRRLEELFREGYGVVTKDIADYRVPLYVLRERYMSTWTTTCYTMPLTDGWRRWGLPPVTVRTKTCTHT